MRTLLLAGLAVAALVLAGGCFPHQPGPRLAHFETRAPAVGEPAPPFVLRDTGGERVALADLLGERPVVLQLGSHSCPVYRYRRFWMDEIYEQYRDRVHFVIVYTVEAHPVGAKSPYADGEWDLWWNRLTGVRVPRAPDEASRRRQASRSRAKLGLAPLMLVDGIDDAVWARYGAASSPAFVIDREGRIAARQVWLEPKKLRRVLDRLLAAPARTPADGSP